MAMQVIGQQKAGLVSKIGAAFARFLERLATLGSFMEWGAAMYQQNSDVDGAARFPRA